MYSFLALGNCDRVPKQLWTWMSVYNFCVSVLSCTVTGLETAETPSKESYQMFNDPSTSEDKYITFIRNVGEH